MGTGEVYVYEINAGVVGGRNGPVNDAGRERVGGAGRRGRRIGSGGGAGRTAGQEEEEKEKPPRSTGYLEGPNSEEPYGAGGANTRFAPTGLFRLPRIGPHCKASGAG